MHHRICGGGGEAGANIKPKTDVGWMDDGVISVSYGLDLKICFFNAFSARSQAELGVVLRGVVCNRFRCVPL